jgi:hypothetical protein
LIFIFQFESTQLRKVKEGKRAKKKHNNKTNSYNHKIIITEKSLKYAELCVCVCVVMARISRSCSLIKQSE